MHICMISNSQEDLHKIENITWLQGNMKFISSVNKISHEWAQRTSDIYCSTRQINFMFSSQPCDIVFIYKGQKKIYMESMCLCIIIRGFWLANENDIFTRKQYRIFYVFKYDFSPWPKTLYFINISVI